MFKISKYRLLFFLILLFALENNFIGAMEAKSRNIDLTSYKIFDKFPVHRTLPILIIEKIKNKSEINKNSNYATFFYLNAIQDNCANTAFYIQKIKSSDLKNYITNFFFRIADDTYCSDQKIKINIKEIAKQITKSQIVDLVSNLENMFRLARECKDSQITELKQIKNQDSNLIDIFFFCLCLFVRSDINKDAYKNSINFLLKVGVIINKQYFNKRRTPLMELILNGQRGIGTLLLYRKNLKKEDMQNMTNQEPEKIKNYEKYNDKKATSARKKLADLVDLLLQNNADPELQDADGINALIEAIKLGNIEIVELLVVKYKVNFEKQNKQGASGLSIAIDNNDKQIIELLKNRANPNQENPNGIPLKL